MKPRIALISLSLAAVVTASAQGLHKEITVDQKIDPVKREASRINVLPTLQLPALSRAQLSFSDRVVTAPVPNSYSILAPMAYGDHLYTSPYRGYISLGAGAPLFNATASAGYRILSSEKTRLSLWGQYDGDIYTTTTSIPLVTPDNLTTGYNDVKNYWRDHSATIGADLHTLVGKTSAVEASLNYTYAYHTLPLGTSLISPYGQNTSRINGSVGYSSTSENLTYKAALRYGHFGFYHSSFLNAADNALKSDMAESYPEKGVRQNQIGLSGLLTLPFSDNSSVGLNVDADFLRSSSRLRALYPYLSSDNRAFEGESTTGLISLTPHYDYTSSTVKASIGAQIDISTNAESTFHVAPEITFAWTPTQLFGFEAKATGGSVLNSLASLYDVTPYISSFFAYSQSHVPFAIDGRFSFGPFFGAYMEVFGGYAKASDWLMPVAGGAYLTYGVFENVDLSAWHVGAAVGYSYRDLFKARVSFEAAPNDYDKSYYEWRDRASKVIKAEMTLKPIKPLTLALGWEFRGGRRIYALVPDNVGSLGAVYTPVSSSLGCISDLSLGATYAISEPFSVFARANNLLNRRYYFIGYREAQETNFLIGASLKF